MKQLKSNTIWLLLALVFWAVTYCIFHFQPNLSDAKHAAERINKDLEKKQNIFQQIQKDTSLFQHMFSNTLTVEEVALLTKLPFYIYAFRNEELIFWNTNSVIGVCNQSDTEGSSLFENNGIYLKQCRQENWLNEGDKLVVLFPIVFRYPLENTYLKSYVIGNQSISKDIEIKQDSIKGAYALKDGSNKSFGYIHSSKYVTEKKTKTFTLLMISFAVLCTIIWMHQIANWLSRIKGISYAIFYLLTVCGIYKIVSHFFGLPFGLSDFDFFSPKIYASSVWLSSIGDVVIYLLFFFWILHFLLQKSERKKSLTQTLIFNGILFQTVVLIPVYLVKSLVLDSELSFDLSNFFDINAFTILGLIIVLLIVTNTIVSILIIRKEFIIQIKTQNYRFISLLLFSVITAFITHLSIIVLCAIVWTLLLYFLIDKKWNSVSLRSSIIFWTAFVTLSSTVLIHHFYEQKEESNRKAFAEQVVNQRDYMMEYLFDEMAHNIQFDEWLVRYIEMPEQQNIALIDDYLAYDYFSGTLNQFDAQYFLFDINGYPLNNVDEVNLSKWQKEASESFPVNEYLYYRENENRIYTAIIPIWNQAKKQIGYLVISLSKKSGKNDVLYPELLQPGNIATIENERKFSYAIYENGKLKRHNSSIIFPDYLPQVDSNNNEVLIDDLRLHLYKQTENKVIAIKENSSEFYESFTLFSYLLGLSFLCGFLLTTIYFIYQLLFKSKSNNPSNLNLQRRIQIAMLGIVVVSFLIIGSFTVLFFSYQFQSNNREQLKRSISKIQEEIQFYFKTRDIELTNFSFDKMTESTEFKELMNQLSQEQSQDINIFNAYGSLNATSQEGIFNKSILTRIMMPKPYFHFTHQTQNSLLINQEQIGNLNYLSAYLPFKNESGETVGYINIPFFAASKDLNLQISNVLIALINIYAVIFLMATFLALFISKWLTKNLQIIINRFQKFTLQQNELLEWPYEDEIGLLVKAYNNMVLKVESQASLLAKNEREGAWRGMAQQVAHEIKNPLTPMKLNIQYLQKAIKSNHPNIINLTEQVSHSMLEQIENLTQIASAFSDFAKLPEVFPEDIEVGSLLQSIYDLYTNNNQVEIIFTPTEQTNFVVSDKNQLYRVFTNLIKNAIEALSSKTDNPTIHIDIKIENETVIISVSDNGSGMNEITAQKIFDPYFTTKGSGSGLGLAMTKRILNYWNGDIWFETKLDIGTTFYVRLPIKK